MKLFKDPSALTGDERKSAAAANLAEWESCPLLTREERAGLEDLKKDPELLEFVMLSLLRFGTAGIRGKMMMGAGGINRFTVALASRALARQIKLAGGENRGVVIACDSRNNSELFARTTACVMALEGIKTYIFDALRPTPELSFAILRLGCQAGVNVTASHNTKEYNGYKAYWDNGAQISVELADRIADSCYELDLLSSVEGCDFDALVKEGKICVVGDELDRQFLDEVMKTSVIDASVPRDMKLVYTPLHGAGHDLVPRILRMDGFENVVTVPEQMILDGNFPTVVKPNPQDKAAFDLGIKLARELGSDVVFATDPDADRAGIAIRTESGFEVLTGNQIGCLLLDFIIDAKRTAGTLPENPACVMSLVSTGLAEKICRANGVKLFRVYTGFKYIGEKIAEFERAGSHTFIFGFEESHGYLAGTYCRDKDAVGAALLICEMAAFYRARGLTLPDVLRGLWKKYGFVADFTHEIVVDGVDPASKMRSVMEKLMKDPPKTLASEAVVTVENYLEGVVTDLASGMTSPTGMAKENMIAFVTSGSVRVTVRPSGTEPKIKVYVSVPAEDQKAAERILAGVLGDLGV